MESACCIHPYRYPIPQSTGQTGVCQNLSRQSAYFLKRAITGNHIRSISPAYSDRDKLPFRKLIRKCPHCPLRITQGVKLPYSHAPNGNFVGYHLTSSGHLSLRHDSSYRLWLNLSGCCIHCFRPLPTSPGNCSPQTSQRRLDSPCQSCLNLGSLF